MAGETAEGRGESRVSFYLLKRHTHEFQCIFINTENSSSAKQCPGNQLCPEPAARDRSTSCALSWEDRHRSELGDRGKSAAAEWVHARGP